MSGGKLIERSLLLSLQFKYSHRAVDTATAFLRAELERLSLVFRTVKAILPYADRVAFV